VKIQPWAADDLFCPDKSHLEVAESISLKRDFLSRERRTETTEVNHPTLKSGGF
jgi:hypothetical protein